MKIRPVFCTILCMLCATHTVQAEEASDDAYYYYLWKRENPTALESDARDAKQTTEPMVGHDQEINAVEKPTVQAEPLPLNTLETPVVQAKPVDVCKAGSPQHAATASSLPDLCATIRKTVQAWAEAWVSKNLDNYLAFYSDRSFVPEDTLSHSAWKKQRARVLSTAGTIRLTLTNVKITQLDPTHLRVTFMQAYWSKKYQDQVKKILSFQLEDGAWKIVREQS